MSRTGERKINLACLAAGAVSWGLFAASRLPVAVPASQGALWVGPSWVWELLAGLAAAALVALLYALQRRYLVGRGLHPAQAAQKAARSWLPSLVLLVLPVCQFWIARPGSLGLAQETWPLFALAVAAAVAGLTLPDRPAGESQTRAPRWLGALALLLAFSLFAGVGHRLAQENRISPLWGGDEPQYLFLAHSLAVDHDLDLYDQILLRENIFFQTPADMIGGHGRPSARRVWLSKHMPGLPFILSPFYAWSLKLGLNPRILCSLAMMLISAWLVWELFALANSLIGRSLPAFWAAALLAFCPPLILFAPSVFPGVAGAAFCLAAFRRIHEPRAWGGLLLAGLLAAGLPWLNERFILPCLVLGLYFLLKGRFKRPPYLLAFGLPLLLSAGLMMAYFQANWGSVLPPLGFHAAGRFLNPRGAWQGLVGLLLGRGEGLLLYAPVWLAGLVGLGWLIRRRPAEGAAALLFFLASWVSAGLYAEWWGGLNPPSRYLLAAAPFLALGLAAGLRWAGPGFGLVVFILGAASLWGSWQELGHLREAMGAAAGHQPFLEQSLVWPLQSGLFPRLVPPGGLRGAAEPLAQGAAWQAGIWSSLLVVFVLWFQRAGRRPTPGRSALGLAAGFALVLLAAGLAGSAGAPQAWHLHQAQKLNLWARLARVGPHGHAPENLAALRLNLQPARHAHPPAHPAGARMRAVLIPSGAGQKPLVWGLYLDLPPGRYRVEARCKALDQGAGPLAWLDVAAEQGRSILAKGEIPAAQSGRIVLLAFRLKERRKGVEIRLGGLGREILLEELALRRLL